MRGAYPRTRGGTVRTTTVISGYGGLSPHTRGNLAISLLVQLASRPIPAHAGEPQSQSDLHVTHGAYPRTRGGTGLAGLYCYFLGGLSPHTRGNLVRAGAPSARSVRLYLHGTKQREEWSTVPFHPESLPGDGDECLPDAVSEGVARLLAERPELKRRIWQLLDAISPSAMLAEGRVYGGGLHELEPKELGHVPIAALADLVGAPTRRGPRRQLEIGLACCFTVSAGALSGVRCALRASVPTRLRGIANGIVPLHSSRPVPVRIPSCRSW